VKASGLGQTKRTSSCQSYGEALHLFEGSVVLPADPPFPAWLAEVPPVLPPAPAFEVDPAAPLFPAVPQFSSTFS